MEKYVEFCSKLGFQAQVPISCFHLCYFIAFMSYSDLSFSTASTYLAGLAFKQKIEGFQDPLDSFVVKKMLAGFRRINPTNHDLRLPITGDILKKIISSLPFITSSNFETKLMHAAFTLAFHGFLRIGEVAANS